VLKSPHDKIFGSKFAYLRLQQASERTIIQKNVPGGGWWGMLRRGVSSVSRRRVKLATVAGAFSLAIFLFASKSNAIEANAQNSAFSALHDYVQLIDTGRQPAGASDQDTKNFPRQESADPAFAALRAFTEQIGAKQPESTRGQPKLAAADNALDALREFLQPGSAPQSSPAATAPNGPVAGGTRRSTAPIEATYVGVKVCVTCHASQAEAFSHTLMGKIGKVQKGKFDCENCHGPGSAHVKAGGVGGIISFRPEDRSRTAEENNEICLACHQRGNRTMWHGSTHDERGLMCTNCHTVMKNVSRKSQLKTAFQPDTCFQCHKNKRADMWRSSHIPVREGKVTCTNCHNPHGSYSEHLLKKATVNEVCYQCHAEKRGPFLWEHPPVQESCLNCHDPHGSNNDFLLKISRPRLCQQCHSGGQHNSNPRNPTVTLYAQGRECQNCHSNHHGSNNPSGARFMR
jgi:DmsE family decaheme c-type cytochrome